MASEIIKYPIYVISKGRWETGYTAKFLIKDEIDFKLVVEPQEFDKYADSFGASRVLALPFSNLGQGSIPARNWVWEHSKLLGAKKHWILDDNISGMQRFIKGKRTDCHSRIAFSSVEEFTDRYRNIAIAGINYSMFGFCSGGTAAGKLPAFYLNSRVYSCLLIRNDLSYRWRGRYNEDTDLCLQVLTDGLCTVNVNVFLIKKKATMTCKGGNTDELYQGNGRLKMARSLEQQWLHKPGLVKTIKRFGRPQHLVNWKTFKTQLQKIT